MTLPFAILALITAASAVAVMSLRNLVHCALSLVVTFAGLAALYLNLNAQFVGFAQILVYVGAVAILIVFALLLTRGTDSDPPSTSTGSAWWGVIIAGAALATLTGSVLSSAVSRRPEMPRHEVTVRQIGDKLLSEYVLPLEVIGLLLTAAMIGAVIIAMQEKRKDS